MSDPTKNRGVGSDSGSSIFPETEGHVEAALLKAQMVRDAVDVGAMSPLDRGRINERLRVLDDTLAALRSRGSSETDFSDEQPSVPISSERGSSDTLCGDPCPEAPDLDSCLLPAGHGGEWHRNIPSSWPTGSSDTRLTEARDQVIEAAIDLRARVLKEDRMGWQLGRWNEAAAFDDALEALATTRADAEQEQT